MVCILQNWVNLIYNLLLKQPEENGNNRKLSTTRIIIIWVKCIFQSIKWLQKQQQQWNHRTIINSNLQKFLFVSVLCTVKKKFSGNIYWHSNTFIIQKMCNFVNKKWLNWSDLTRKYCRPWLLRKFHQKYRTIWYQWLSKMYQWNWTIYLILLSAMT